MYFPNARFLLCLVGNPFKRAQHGNPIRRFSICWGKTDIPASRRCCSKIWFWWYVCLYVAVNLPAICFSMRALFFFFSLLEAVRQGSEFDEGQKRPKCLVIVWQMASRTLSMSNRLNLNSKHLFRMIMLSTNKNDF